MQVQAMIVGDIPFPNVKFAPHVSLNERDFTSFMFQSATVLLDHQSVIHCFPDNIVTIIPIERLLACETVIEIDSSARYHGYTNTRRYVFERELTYHYVADLMGQPYSYVRHHSYDNRLRNDELAMVSDFLRFARLGKVERDVMRWRFGHRLQVLRSALRDFYGRLPERYYQTTWGSPL